PMPHPFEQPYPARRPHPGFVLVEHHRLFAGDAELGEDPFELSAEFRGAAFVGIVVVEGKRIEMASAADMSLPVVLRRAGVDEDDVGVASMFTVPSRVNQHSGL